MTFASLGLSEPLLRALADLAYETPTAIQRAAVPLVLQGRDVWASAQTGSGKTAAFMLPIIERLSASRREALADVRVLVLVPTRELATQIEQAIRGFVRYLPPHRTCLAVGGVSINPQMLALRGGADIVVATPGRLLDLLAHHALRLSSLETLVLDEADRMFSLGFAEELNQLLALVPSSCQKLLFSATFPDSVRAFAEALLRDPERIAVADAVVAEGAGIEQRAIEVDLASRTPLLRHLLQSSDWSRVLVFVASRHGAEHVAAKLTKAGFDAAPLHGELSQGARAQALEDLKAERLRVLVATDVAARGLDIAGLSAVVNYDLPRSPVDYLHRIGRTGRAGEKGVALSFVSASTAAHFRLLEKRHQLALPREQIAGFEPQELAEPPRDPSGGVKGRRRSKKDKLREAAALAATTGKPRN
ncbi:MAG: DEAD/DEAH box helicase [Pseudomonadota bacterium]